MGKHTHSIFDACKRFLYHFPLINFPLFSEECASLASSADDIMSVLEGEGGEVDMEEISAVIPDKSWTSLGGEGSVH